jgi:ATP-dependent protease ClpP protease subunit
LRWRLRWFRCSRARANTRSRWGFAVRQPLERVSKDMERDYFMTPEEAREYGIIDRVLAHR